MTCNMIQEWMINLKMKMKKRTNKVKLLKESMNVQKEKMKKRIKKILMTKFNKMKINDKLHINLIKPKYYIILS
jgi:hypothetical protein